jgi:uncharacterized phage-associated protein
MFKLTFEFSLEKTVQAIAFFSQSGVPGLTKLKVAKLLYFADKAHLLTEGSPIIGDVYFCMENGPVPSFALNEMNEAINSTLSKPEVPLTETSDVNVFTRVLNIKKGSPHPTFEAKQPCEASVFSTSELEVLKDTVRLYGNKSASQLITLTHDEPTWQLANEQRPHRGRAPIFYDLFFVGAPESSQRFLAKLVAEQFGEAISLAGDADYAAFTEELGAYSLKPDEITESDIRTNRSLSRA